MFENDVVVSVLVVAVPLLIGKFFAYCKDELKKRELERYTDAVEALEVGVHDAWSRFGRAWKTARLDNKLSEEERRRLNGVALSMAEKVGGEKGIDIAETIGRKTVPLLMRKIIERRKGGQ